MASLIVFQSSRTAIYDPLAGIIHVVNHPLILPLAIFQEAFILPKAFSIAVSPTVNVVHQPSLPFFKDVCSTACRPYRRAGSSLDSWTGRGKGKVGGRDNGDLIFAYK